MTAGLVAVQDHDLRMNPEHGLLHHVLPGVLPVLFADPLLPRTPAYADGDWFDYTADVVAANDRAGTLDDVLFWFRVVPLLVGAATGVLLYALGARLISRVGGLIAAGLWLTTPYVVGLAHLSSLDVSFAFALVGLALLLDRYRTDPTPGRLVALAGRARRCAARAPERSRPGTGRARRRRGCACGLELRARSAPCPGAGRGRPPRVGLGLLPRRRSDAGRRCPPGAVRRAGERGVGRGPAGASRARRPDADRVAGRVRLPGRNGRPTARLPAGRRVDREPPVVLPGQRSREAAVHRHRRPPRRARGLVVRRGRATAAGRGGRRGSGRDDRGVPPGPAAEPRTPSRRTRTGARGPRRGVDRLHPRAHPDGWPSGPSRPARSWPRWSPTPTRWPGRRRRSPTATGR